MKPESFIHIPPYLDCTEPKKRVWVTFLGKVYRIKKGPAKPAQIGDQRSETDDEEIIT